ncbi:aminofutalosine synthase MqnE [Candidatus Riflebacteria bacterium]
MKKTEIEEKVRANVPLNFEEGVFLFQQNDLPWLGNLAFETKKKKSGNKVFYVRNQHINYSNVCKNSCKFCAFGQDKQSNKSFQLDINEILEKAKWLKKISGCEFHIVGGLHPHLPFEFYIQLLQSLKKHFPLVKIKAFSAAEIEFFATKFSMSIEKVLQKLMAAGLETIPGGGAEIFNTEIRNKLCPEKLTAESWLNVHRVAHQLGMKTTCTLLYGHIEKIEHRVEHMLQLRTLQTETGGFSAFIPLAFIPNNTALSNITRASGITDLKMVAIGRLFLHNIEHIKTYWIVMGKQVAQLALFYGADCFDGTIGSEKIMHMAGQDEGCFLSTKGICEIIEEAGLIAVERDTNYDEIQSISPEGVSRMADPGIFEKKYSL